MFASWRRGRCYVFPQTGNRGRGSPQRQSWEGVNGRPTGNERNIWIGNVRDGGSGSKLGRGVEWKVNDSFRGRRRWPWNTKKVAIQDAGDSSFYWKFLGMRFGIILDRARFARGEPSG